MSASETRLNAVTTRATMRWLANLALDCTP